LASFKEKLWLFIADSSYNNCISAVVMALTDIVLWPMWARLKSLSQVLGCRLAQLWLPEWVWYLEADLYIIKTRFV
jgi:hypothetical protein